jgi:hypothetical protein
MDTPAGSIGFNGWPLKYTITVKLVVKYGLRFLAYLRNQIRPENEYVFVFLIGHMDYESVF